MRVVKQRWFLILALTLAGAATASVTNVWQGTNGALASAGANWSLGHSPSNTETVFLDSDFSNMTWDASATNTVAAWGQTANYTGTVTFATVFGTNGFTNFTITGDANLLGGAWTHRLNTAVETNRLWVTVAGNLFLTNAVITADGCGWGTGLGPGGSYSGTGKQRGGGSYGGQGGDVLSGTYTGNASRITYGSIASPTNLGSGGGSEAGAGAIALLVSGTSTVAGAISASTAANTAGAGAGGSIFLTTGWLTGGGSIRANGGAGGGFGGSGAGGRMAIVLTGAGADFSTWNGTNTAYGGNSGTGGTGQSGAAGTVYLQTAAGVNTLIVNNNGTAIFTQNTTLMPTGVNLNSFSNVIINGSGVLGINGDTTLNFAAFTPVTSGPANSYITIVGDTNVTYPGNWMFSNYTLRADGISKTLTNVTIGSAGALACSANVFTNTCKINLQLLGNLTVVSNASINVDGCGWSMSQGPGMGGQTGSGHGGANYGGIGGDVVSGSYISTAGRGTYGTISAPTDIGSGGNNSWPGTGGGGAIILSVAGTSTVAGAISASGPYNGYGGGSGGSIFLTTGWLTSNGTIRANGGVASSWGGGGGGGRVAVVLTGAGAGFSTWTGTNTSYGGAFSGAGIAGAAGTVYLSGGSVLIDNQNSATNGAYTALPAFTNSLENIKQTQWTVQNKGRAGLVTNVWISSLNLKTNAYLELAGKTLTVQALTITNKVYVSGTYTAAQLASTAVTDGSGSGKVVILARGTGVFFR